MRVDRAVKDVSVSVGKVLDALANNLTPGDNFLAKLVSVASTGAADTEFAVTHGLGIKPVIYIWNIDRNGVVYDSRRADWTDRQLFLKCSVSNAVVNLLVM